MVIRVISRRSKYTTRKRRREWVGKEDLRCGRGREHALLRDWIRREAARLEYVMSERLIIDPIAAANGSLCATGRIESKSKPWREVLVVVVTEAFRKAVCSDLNRLS